MDGAHEVYTVNLFNEASVDGRETVPLHATATVALQATFSHRAGFLPTHHVAFVARARAG